MNNLSHEAEKIYFGLDVSQKTIEVFTLMGEEGLSMGKISNSRQCLEDFFDKFPVSASAITVALETGTHSAWISRCLEKRGYEVIVANARDLAFIYKGDKKSDRIDAEKLARVARADKKLLHPVKLMDRKRQEALLAIKARDLLVKQRTCIINAIRGFLRSFGIDDTEYSHETINDLYSGNGLLRRLLVQGAQYIMGPFGEDCDLRNFGNRIAQRGGRIARKKAKVAVARKLAITLLALWRNPDVAYDPHFKTNRRRIA